MEINKYPITLSKKEKKNHLREKRHELTCSKGRDELIKNSMAKQRGVKNCKHDHQNTTSIAEV